MTKVREVVLVCDVCGKPGAEEVAIIIDGDRTAIDVCEQDLAERTVAELVEYGKSSVEGGGIVTFSQFSKHLADQQD